MIENGGGFPENEIDVTFDITVAEIIAAGTVGEDGILPAEEPAIVESVAVAGDFDGQGLTVRAEGVLKGDIFDGDIVAEDSGAWGGEGADGLAIGAGPGFAEIECEDGFCRVITPDMNVRSGAGDSDLLLVGSRKNVNVVVEVGIGGNGVDGLLDGLECAGAVLGDGEVGRQGGGRNGRGV